MNRRDGWVACPLVLLRRIRKCFLTGYVSLGGQLLIMLVLSPLYLSSPLFLLPPFSLQSNSQSLSRVALGMLYHYF